MKYRFLAVSVFCTLLACNAVAQRTFGGVDNVHNSSMLALSGTVSLLDGAPVRDARVEVHDLMSGTLITSAYSLPNGSFTFYGVPRGHYEIRATSGLQEARERVDLESIDQQVTLHLTQRSDAKDSGATVSVAEMRVPDKAKKEYEKAEQAFAKHKLDEAAAHCAKALAEAPSYARALTLSALLDLSTNKLLDAVQVGEQAIKADYGYGLAYVVLASAYNALQRYDDSLRTLERAMPLVPNSWQAHFEMAKSYLGKGDYQHSLESADRAERIAPPQYGPIHLVRAHALLGLKAYQEAVAELEKYVGADPKGVYAADARKTLDQVKAFVATAKK